MEKIYLQQLNFAEATKADIPVMTDVMTRSFDDDSRRFQGKPEGGPDGYNDGRFFTLWMQKGRCWKILYGERIIGAFLIFENYPQKGSNVLGTIFLDPEFQNQGIGSFVMNYVHRTFPAKRWVLDTPEWHTRNHHFYEKLGYRKVGEQEEPHAGFKLRIYQKEMNGVVSGGGMQPLFRCLVM
ncbi:MAG: GNAT family N-acetyltransferase [Promethearchaeota archaeon]